MKIKNYWLRFGCFLTGHRYEIISGCSELAAKRVKRFTSAMLIITMLWAFVGFTFSSRYLKTEWYLSLIGALTTIIIIVQIERIIILSPKNNVWPIISRIVIGLAMALVGSVIIDQIIFKEDIEKEKLFADQEKIERLFQSESSELRRQINQIDTALTLKEHERQKLYEDISKKPTQTYYSKQVTTQKDPGDSIAAQVITTSATQQANPKINILKSVDEQIQKLVDQKREKETLLLNLMPVVEAKVKKNTGFIDELEVLFILLSKSITALIVWILWIIVLLGLELLVILGKIGDKDTDYEARLDQQMQLHYKRIELLGRQ